MPRGQHDPSIEHEPHFSAGSHAIDPSEQKAERILAEAARREKLDDAVDRTVWDEPALAAGLAGPDDGSRLTYARWLDWRRATTSAGRTWAVTLAVALVAGPWAILGAMISGAASGGWGLVALCVVGPITEEMMKVAAALWVVERRPYLFGSTAQIILCGLTGGLVFAAIENLVYLHIYVPGASPQLAAYRWTACVALHGATSTIAALGLAAMWRRTIDHGVRPELTRAAPWIATAMGVHGLYNGLVTVAEMVGWLKL